MKNKVTKFEPGKKYVFDYEAYKEDVFPPL